MCKSLIWLHSRGSSQYGTISKPQIRMTKTLMISASHLFQFSHFSNTCRQFRISIFENSDLFGISDFEFRICISVIQHLLLITRALDLIYLFPELDSTGRATSFASTIRNSKAKNSDQALLWLALSTYRCFLPDLAGFIDGTITRPDRQRTSIPCCCP